MPVKKNDDKRIYNNRHYDSALMIQHAVGDESFSPSLLDIGCFSARGSLISCIRKDLATVCLGEDGGASR